MPEWAKWNGPYFEEYEKYKDVNDFRNLLIRKDRCRCILVDDKAIGMASR